MAGQGGLRARGRICVIFSINLKYFQAARWISHIDFIKGRDKTCLEPLWIGNRHEIMYLLSGHWFQGQKEMIFIFPPVLHDVIHPIGLLDYHSELIITTLGWARQQHQSNFLSNWSENVKLKVSTEFCGNFHNIFRLRLRPPSQYFRLLAFSVNIVNAAKFVAAAAASLHTLFAKIDE